MSVEKVEKFLKENDLSFRETDTHYQVDCPLCTDTRKRLGIFKKQSKLDNEDHHWHCFNCDHSGKSLKTLLKAMFKLKKLGRKEFVEYKDEEKVTVNQTLGEACHEILKKPDKKDAVRYIIEERGLTKEAIKYFKLGFRSKFKNKDGEVYEAGPHISLPYYEGDKLVNLKYRALDPEVDKQYKWRREKGCKTSLFNYNVLGNHEYDTIYIAESEIDCMTLWCNGFQNTVGLTAGAKTFKQDWYDILQRFEKVYLVLDNDKEGQKGAYKIAKRLGLGRCWNITLPDDVKDPNDFFKKYSKQDFESLIRKARQFDVDGVITLRDSINQGIRELIMGVEQEEGIITPWAKINKIMGKLTPGNLITIAAKPKVGKTTLVMNWLLFLAKSHISSLNFQCEMESQDMRDKYIKMEYPGVIPDLDEYLTQDTDDILVKKQYELDKEELIRIRRWGKMKLPVDRLISFHPKQEDLDIEKVVGKCTEVVQRFGSYVVVIDNLHFLCRGDKAKEKIEIATQRFKQMARDLGIVVILITHPRKTNHNRPLTNDDLKDSASIFQDSDAVILMHRAYMDEDQIVDTFGDEDDDDDEDYEQMLNPLTEIKITARRHKGGKSFLAFNDDRAIFKDNGPMYDQLVGDKFKELQKKNKKKNKGF